MLTELTFLAGPLLLAKGAASSLAGCWSSSTALEEGEDALAEQDGDLGDGDSLRLSPLEDEEEAAGESMIEGDEEAEDETFKLSGCAVACCAESLLLLLLSAV